jgi:rubrerythrin
MNEGRGERVAGTPDTIYDLSSVLFHALEGGASYDTYIEDAEREGDEELTEFFRRVREEDRDRASEAWMLIAARTEGATAGASPGLEPTTGLPGTKQVEEEVPSGEAQRGTSPEALPRTEGSPGEQERRIERERENESLIDRARGYLLGEDRERDYLGGEGREEK